LSASAPATCLPMPRLAPVSSTHLPEISSMALPLEGVQLMIPVAWLYGW
jgi:hypothetical protein